MKHEHRTHKHMINQLNEFIFRVYQSYTVIVLAYVTKSFVFVLPTGHTNARWFYIYYVYVNVALHKHHNIGVQLIVHMRFSRNDVIMSSMASQITSLTVVYSTVYSGGDQRKHQSSASLAFVRGIHRWPMNSPHIGPVTRKLFPFDDVIIVNNIDETRPVRHVMPTSLCLN